MTKTQCCHCEEPIKSYGDEAISVPPISLKPVPAKVQRLRFDWLTVLSLSKDFFAENHAPRNDSNPIVVK